jgi:hypothetical protein
VTTADARHPVHIGRIANHSPNWTWFQLDRSTERLRVGDVIRVRPVSEDAPFRTGECRVLGVFADFVHLERPAWTDIVAIADMDHVYLTERPRPYAPGEKMTDRHPDSVIAQVVEETIAKHPGMTKLVQKRAGYQPLAPQPEPALRLTAKDGALYVDTKHGPVKVTADPTVPRDEVRFEHTILSADLDAMLAEYERTRPGPRPPIDFAKLQKAPAQPGRQWVEPVVYEPGSKQRDAFTQAVSRAVAVQDLAQQGHITLEEARSLMQAPQTPVRLDNEVMTATEGDMSCFDPPPRRPDGFDQRQVDVARAALLAPAPPRYPRTR